ncbi:LD-carboxypeptidase [Clostridium tagluense]|uniref:S66 family peptidase n=1 Tax=Clostridium tagluense TaxID=360422 RepID=UPI001C0DA101|nr:S66 peptidase family protein [Clostridium tagluense]MBU3127875.1 LD-carboxypeptidase [Clostridium tagluense]MCB2312936.1 LD-carboxypeptidase [Clostridium tagluense]MCB2317702.1 LD-carboxypeptidase [Clostridium tagluense]MCB2322463.1 LD-carboxypeptidase [Clostridium tagluense]MCB2327466.1 LD-carboxypeptidase [Clostridium tagluense]
MKKSKPLVKGDKVAVISMSSGMLGEDFAKHELDLGLKRIKEFGLVPVVMPSALRGIEYLKNHPEARAQDLKDAFYDTSIKGIICAIGGDDTYKTLPYLLDDNDFIKAVHNNPKLFTGFSDTTINHLMFYKLGIGTFYGPTLVCDLAELDKEMLPYTRKTFLKYFESHKEDCIESSNVWYEERTDFSRDAVGTSRVEHLEERGYEVLQGKGKFSGRLLGGCLESLYAILTNTRYDDEKAICEKYRLFPTLNEWKNKILFIETCEEKPKPEVFEKELIALKDTGIFDVINGIIVGKPQDEQYYEEYKEIYYKIIENKDLPIMYNVNFGHAQPRCIIPYGIEAEVDLDIKVITLKESIFA